LENASDLTATLIGRDFDLLRLEKILLSKRIIYICGPPGVGKTALLQYSCSIWAETSFFDIIISFDFATGQIHDGYTLVQDLLEQLELASDQSWKSPLQSLRSTLKHPQDVKIVCTSLSKMLSPHRILAITDSLHFWPLGLNPKNRPGCLNPSSISDICDILGQILGFDSKGKSVLKQQPYIIFVALAPDLPPETSSGNWPKPYKFELCGLQQKHAIKLATSIFRVRKHNGDAWTLSDISEVELVYTLLQGLPAAIKSVIVGLQEKSIGVHHLFRSIHKGVPFYDRKSASTKMPDYSIFQELQLLYNSMKKTLAGTFIALGMYWSRGPNMPWFAHEMAKLELTSEEDNVPAVIYVLESLGYLKVGDLCFITWVHPLLTIFLRTLALDSTIRDYKEHQAVGNFVLKRIVKHFAHGSHAKSDPERAAHLVVKSLGLGDENILTSISKAESTIFVASFLQEQDVSRFTQKWMEHIRGYDFEDMRKNGILGFENMSTCVDICTNPSLEIPLEK